MKLKLKKIRNDRPPIRFDLKSIPEKYRLTIQNRFLDLMTYDDHEKTPEAMWQDIKNAILETAKSTIPLRKRSKEKDWISTNTLRTVDMKRKIKAMGLCTEKNKKKYRELNKAVKSQLRTDMEAHIRQQCDDLESKRITNKSRDHFTAVKNLTNTPLPKLNVVKDENGNILTESNEIKNRWKEYCENLYKQKEENNLFDIISEYEEEPCILQNEVANAIRRMKTCKAPGIDDIPAELIKASGETGVKIFHKLCNKIWKKKEWPTDWTKSVFLPIPKKGDTRECSNNRTVALICHASKIILYIMIDRIQNHLDQEISKVQAGFTKGRGTRDQIANMTWIIEKFRELNRPLFLTFIDYSKAFDTVQHERLWYILGKMEFPAHITDLMRSLYANQTASVRTNCGNSDWFGIGQGVRQG